MTLSFPPQFMVCKYIADPRRQEPRNIGIILMHPNGITARFAGEDLPGDIDGRRVRSLVTDTRAYQQWVEYWRYCTSQIRSDRIDDSAFLVRLRNQLISSSKQNYVVTEGGSVLVPGAEDKDPITLLSYLYNELVEAEPEPAPSEKIDLERRTSQLLQEAGLYQRALFYPQPKVEVLNRRGVKETLHPSYLYLGEKYNVIEPISLHMSSEKSAQRAVDATQYMYEKLDNHARVANNKEAVFTSIIDARPERYTYNLDELVELLGSWGPVINVADSRSSKTTLERINNA